MATSTFFCDFTNAGAKLQGYTGHIYLVPSGSAVNNLMPLTEDSGRPGQYFRENVPDGEYKIYLDLDKSGSPVEGDLYKIPGSGNPYLVWHGENKVSKLAANFNADGTFKNPGNYINPTLVSGSLTDTSETTLSDWLKSDYIKLTNFNKVYIFGYADANVLAVSFYTDATSASRMTDYNVHGSGSAGTEELLDKYVDVPSGAKYVRFCMASAAYKSYTPVASIISFSAFDSDVYSDMANVLQNIQFKDKKDVTGTLVAGSLTDTSETTLSDWLKSDFIDLTGFSQVYIHGYADSNVLAVSFYSGKSKITKLSTYSVHGSGGAGTEALLDKYVDIPSNAKYVRFCMASKTYKNYLPAAILVNRDDKIFRMGGKSITNVTLSSGVLTDSADASDVNWVKSAYISVEEYSKVHIYGYADANILSVSFYTAQTSGSRLTDYNVHGSGGTGTEELLDKFIDIPSNAKYVRFCMASSSYKLYNPSAHIINVSTAALFDSRLHLSQEEINSKSGIIDIYPYSAAQKVIKNKLTAISDGVYVTNQAVYPGGAYNAVWLRDYAYALSGNYIFDSDSIKTIYNWFKSKIPTSGPTAYWVPDWITKDGVTVSWAPFGSSNHSVYDSPGFLVDVADKYVEQTRDLAFIASEIDFLEAMLRSIMDPSTYMCYVTPGKEVSCYGFEDIVKFNGNIGFITLQLFNAFSKLQKWADMAGIAKTLPVQEIAAAFNNTFVYKFTYNNQKCGLCKASDGLSAQCDIWLTAFSVYSGILNGENENRCISGLAEYFNEYYYKGQIQHVPTSLHYSPSTVWESMFTSSYSYGTYQNGGFWFTPVLWVLQSLKKDKLKRINVREKITEIAGYVLQLNFPEYITLANATVNTGYLSSAVFTTLLSDLI